MTLSAARDVDLTAHGIAPTTPLKIFFDRFSIAQLNANVNSFFRSIGHQRLKI